VLAKNAAPVAGYNDLNPSLIGEAFRRWNSAVFSGSGQAGFQAVVKS